MLAKSSMKVRIGNAELVMGSEHLQELRDSSHLVDSAQDLQDELAETGLLVHEYACVINSPAVSMRWA
jgi:hypothetical protein